MCGTTQMLESSAASMEELFEEEPSTSSLGAQRDGGKGKRARDRRSDGPPEQDVPLKDLPKVPRLPGCCAQPCAALAGHMRCEALQCPVYCLWCNVLSLRVGTASFTFHRESSISIGVFLYMKIREFSTRS